MIRGRGLRPSPAAASSAFAGPSAICSAVTCTPEWRWASRAFASASRRADRSAPGGGICSPANGTYAWGCCSPACTTRRGIPYIAASLAAHSAAARLSFEPSRPTVTVRDMSGTPSRMCSHSCVCAPATRGTVGPGVRTGRSLWRRSSVPRVPCVPRFAWLSFVVVTGSAGRPARSAIQAFQRGDAAAREGVVQWAGRPVSRSSPGSGRPGRWPSSEPAQSGPHSPSPVGRAQGQNGRISRRRVLRAARLTGVLRAERRPWHVHVSRRAQGVVHPPAAFRRTVDVETAALLGLRGQPKETVPLGGLGEGEPCALRTGRRAEFRAQVRENRHAAEGEPACRRRLRQMAA